MRQWTLFYSGLTGQGQIHSTSYRGGDGDEYIDVVERNDFLELQKKYREAMSYLESAENAYSACGSQLAQAKAEIAELRRQLAAVEKDNQHLAQQTATVFGLNETLQSENVELKRQKNVRSP